MRAYWIHYSAIENGAAPKFGVIESDASGRQNMLSPPGRLASPDEVVRVLISKGANPAEASDRVGAAMRQGIAHLLVRDAES